jgi:hypothetical protein
MDSKQYLLSTTDTMLHTNYGLNKKIARKKSDAIKYQRCLSDKSINLVNNNKIELIDMTGGSDINNCSNNIITNTNKRERLFNKRIVRQLHPGLNRLRNDSVTRSKSFQEQNTQPKYERRLNNSRFFIKRLHRDDLPEYSSDDTISQNIDMITLSSSQNDCGSDSITEKYIYVPDKSQIDYNKPQQQPVQSNRPSLLFDDGGRSANFSCYRQRTGDKNYSGHILGRIFRRMRKISLGWRKSKCKLYRGDFFLTLVFFLFYFLFVYTIVLVTSFCVFTILVWL